MESAVKVRFDGIWKKFRRGATHDSLRDLLPSLVKSAVGRRPKAELGVRDFWALRDINFEVEAGKALGIIGRNGAGKSTTLKILTRILAPTRGTYRTVGRVGALIEVAAGFHPDLTGRENVYLQAAILGMPRQMVERAFDSIVDFAGVEAFIDTPVKRYSSGMNARLGFAVAAHLEPDVLIIDEVLSVGDTAFQAKCIDRMRAFKREGAAIVFVSHNMQAVNDLCDDAIQLDEEVVRRGTATEVVRDYLAAMAASGRNSSRSAVQIESFGFARADGSPADVVESGATLAQGIRVSSQSSFDDWSIVMVVRRATDNFSVYERWYSRSELGLEAIGPERILEIRARFTAHLLHGLYNVTWSVYDNKAGRFLGALHPAAIFQVDEQESRGGVAALALEITGNHAAGASAA